MNTSVPAPDEGALHKSNNFEAIARRQLEREKHLRNCRVGVSIRRKLRRFNFELRRLSYKYRKRQTSKAWHRAAMELLLLQMRLRWKVVSQIKF